MAPDTLWLTDSGKLAVGAGNAPHYCDTCPCGGPQAIERVLWEREQAADIEAEWTVSTSYTIGDLIASKTDDTTNLRWFYRATTNHFSTADTEAGVGVDWANEWEVATLTLAECQTKLNALGPYYVDSLYTGGASAPAAHPSTYGNDAADLTDALEDAADLLSTLHDSLEWSTSEYYLIKEAEASSSEDDFWAAMDVVEAGSPLGTASTNKTFATQSKGFGVSGPDNDAGAIAYTLTGMTLDRDHNAALSRSVSFYAYRNDPGASSFVNNDTHGESGWLWPVNEWGLVDTQSAQPPATQDVTADDPTGGRAADFNADGNRPPYTPGSTPNKPRRQTWSIQDPIALAAWAFNTYPNGYTA